MNTNDDLKKTIQEAWDLLDNQPKDVHAVVENWRIAYNLLPVLLERLGVSKVFPPTNPAVRPISHLEVELSKSLAAANDNIDRLRKEAGELKEQLSDAQARSDEAHKGWSSEMLARRKREKELKPLLAAVQLLRSTIRGGVDSLEKVREYEDRKASLVQIAAQFQDNGDV